MKYLSPVVLTGILVMFDPQIVLAQDQVDVHPYLTAKFGIELGVFFPDREATYRADVVLPGPTEPIDFGSAIGFNQSEDSSCSKS